MQNEAFDNPDSLANNVRSYIYFLIACSYMNAYCLCV